MIPTIKKWLTAAVLLMVTTIAMAQPFDLPQLAEQLSGPAVVRGDFIQEKHLRALPQPLTSHGRFVLARDHGLLWLLQQPIRQDYRITPQGIARRGEQGWQAVDPQGGSARQNQLFLAVLSGDTQALQRDFDLQLNGDPDAWRLQLTPRGALLKQIFADIEIQGGETVTRIELHETQGDRTLIRLLDSQTDVTLTASEQRDLAD
ncbi:LolA family protein [Stutzerimonas frequens]|uniref:LolA family protein n=1 Tax=Stutzerimonas frequens TaxID=2968969 RepID=UPI00190AA38C|nr:outer membrane lipoprotein carrier protein LolA [Stutzerimonas frequens]MBK3759004.1 outer membrane lipoprotein carrier protein LolA [Stutzerimonas frequens]MBK3873250.1 outer membrane lipoprotein carrier protein LolA [Stutzerimonas frequens]MBK3911519.1 outer membrane lipoprotein carrier protein LolA [Stutzerimonas frequens]MBK3930802.1 outer membrane lipoprotein carrier protein LolA [Stutzerimonas frequens]